MNILHRRSLLDLPDLLQPIGFIVADGSGEHSREKVADFGGGHVVISQASPEEHRGEPEFTFELILVNDR